METAPPHGVVATPDPSDDIMVLSRSNRRGTTVGFTKIAGSALVLSTVTAKRAVKVAEHEYRTRKSQLDPCLNGTGTGVSDSPYEVTRAHEVTFVVALGTIPKAVKASAT